MKEVAALIVIAIVFGVLALLTRSAGGKSRNLETATAIIDRLTHSDGDIIYYVRFYREGKLIEGKSIIYPGSGKRLQEGATVNVDYYFTKAGWPRVIIQDPELNPRERTTKKLPKVLAAISVGFLIVAILLFFKKLLPIA